MAKQFKILQGSQHFGSSCLNDEVLYYDKTFSHAGHQLLVGLTSNSELRQNTQGLDVIPSLLSGAFLLIYNLFETINPVSKEIL